MTYDELAKRCGMTYNGIVKIAKHQNRSIQYASVEKLTQALNITANSLMGYLASLPEPEIAIHQIYPVSDKNHSVFKVQWQIENYDLRLQFTVVLTPLSPDQEEMEFCLDEVEGDYSEDFLYSLLQRAPQTFHEAIAASAQEMTQQETPQNRKRQKVVFSLGKENNLFYRFRLENLEEEREHGH